MEAPIVWTPPAIPKRGGSIASPDGLLATLRVLRVGERVLVPGWTAHQCNNNKRAARRGTNKWFTAQTTETGALIVREQ